MKNENNPSLTYYINPIIFPSKMFYLNPQGRKFKNKKLKSRYIFHKYGYLVKLKYLPRI